MDVVRIKKPVLQAIINHALVQAPLECCGLLAGETELITHHRPMNNLLHSPVRYAMDPRELFQFFKDLRASNERHLGIYHSHPSSEARPSRIDIEESFYPDCAYLIISLAEPHSPQVRAFQIQNGAVAELEMIEFE